MIAPSEGKLDILNHTPDPQGVELAYVRFPLPTAASSS